KWQDGGVNERSYFITVKPTGQIQFLVSPNGVNTYSVISTNAITLNEWTHVSGVFDGDAQELRVYIDGVQLGTTATTFATIFDNAQPLLLGSGKVGGAAQSYFHGSIDDAAVYSRALSTTELNAIVRSGGGAKGGNTVAGNLIGTDVSGTRAVGNGSHGVYLVNSSGNTVGGITAGSGNVIAGNTWSGIVIHANNGTLPEGNFIQGNYIGTDITGTQDLG
ncbi:MAG: LamG domain-containing protein, partial [Planctomycetales bacterium]|nr:LamG domain-containing protein [Planctomycetales bacterium]